MFYRGKSHRRLFKEELRKVKNHDRILYPELIAGLYLLTADNSLWSRARREYSFESVNFDGIDLKGISTTGYTFCKLAQGFIEGSNHLEIPELADSSIIYGNTSRVINQAINISRDGLDLKNI